MGIADTCSTEDGGSVDGDTSNTNPFLHNLKPNDELDTATGMKFARADTEEHSKVGLSLSSLAFELGNVADILEFSFGLAQVLPTFTTEATKDIACFFLTANFCEPTG